MKCASVLLVASLICSTASAQDPSTLDLYVGAKDGEVRLLWVPRMWRSTLEGFVVKRRAAGGEWEQLGAMIAPRSYYLENRIDLNGLRRDLLENPRSAHEDGFAFVDRTIPKQGAAVSYDYALHFVEGGQLQATPADTVTWDSNHEVDLDIGMKAVDNLWDDKGVETFVKVDGRKLLEKAVGFRVIEHRGKQERDLYRLIRPEHSATEWEYLCHQAKAPYPDAITIVVEDNFGFQISATSKISDRPPKTQRAAVPARRCWGPVVMSVNPGGEPPPREPPPMRARR
jgi:hypothetical protein